MAFPTAPTDGQQYTNALGTKYAYSSADTAWKIVSQEVDKNFDGGFANSTYLPSQNVDGGGA